MGKHKGVSVIVVLMGLLIVGLITVTLPKCQDISNQAATLNKSIAGALQIAIERVNALWEVQGGVGSGIEFNGKVVPINSFGWPDGNGGVSPGLRHCAEIMNSLLPDPPEVVKAQQDCQRWPCYVIEAETKLIGGRCVYKLNGTEYDNTIIYDLISGKVEAS